MIFQRIKITVKMLVCSVVFLVPMVIILGIMLSNTNDLIEQGRKEQRGIETVKILEGLFELVPRHLRIAIGFDADELAPVELEITNTLEAFEQAITNYNGLGFTDHALEVRNLTHIKLANIRAEWNSIRTMPREDIEAVLDAYMEFIRIIQAAILYMGDISALILDPELGGYYFTDVALNMLPQTEVRLLSIASRVRLSRFQIARTLSARGLNTDTIRFDRLPEIDKNILSVYTTLLQNSDHVNVISAYTLGTIETREVWGEQILLDPLQSAAAAYTDSMQTILATLGNILAEQYGTYTFRSVSDDLVVVNRNVYRFSLALLDQLHVIIEHRIGMYRKHNLQLLFFVSLAVLFAFAVLLLSMVDIRKSVKSLRRLFTSLRDNDLSLALDIHSKDEFGELMTAFNGFLGKLRTVFTSFKQSAALVSSSVYDISASTKEITTTANEQSASVSEIVSTMEGSKNLSEQMAAKTEEVAHLARETQGLSQKGADLRNANEAMMEGIQNQNAKIIYEIKNLVDMIKHINDAIRIIDGIADQTKLIAFNASLEASSSGESGARFSVVASEIRRFADNVVDSTREIKLKIEEVQTASQTLITEAFNGSKKIEQGYEHMGAQKAVFEAIVETAQNVATRSQQISNLSKQQEYASSQIFEALKEISAGVRQFVAATSSTSKIADSLNDMSTGLQKAIEQYRTE